MSDWGNLLLVTTLPSKDAVVATWLWQPGASGLGWMCPNTSSSFGDTWQGYSNCMAISPGSCSTCTLKSLSSNAANWTIPSPALCYLNGKFDANCHLPSASIQPCLANPLKPHCQVKISTSILWVVVACNVLKILCMTIATATIKFEPLATVGDAIASFLDHPENSTANLGALSFHDAQNQVDFRFLAKDYENGVGYCVNSKAAHGNAPTWKVNHKPYERRTRRWGSVVSVSKWWHCYVWYGVTMMAAMKFTPIADSANSCVIAVTIGFPVFLSSGWEQAIVNADFGTFSTQNLVTASSRWSLLANVVFANLPQLLVSLLYLVYNNMLTAMLTAHECTKFARERRGLRVSQPRGEQRTTFWLQLPYRYILPVMAVMAVFHWTLSRSLFFVNITEYNNPRANPGSPLAFATGYSPLAILVSFNIGLAMMLGIAGVAFRKLDPGMPITGSCSLALSAACHPRADEMDVAFKRLMYGVLGSGPNDDEHDRAGFSSKPVTPLMSGVVYS